MIKDIHSNRFSILNVSRQIGTSTIFSIYILYYVSFFEMKNVHIVGIPNATGKMYSEIFNLYEKLPFFIKKGIVDFNRDFIKFDNGCIIRFSQDLSIGTGQSIDYLVLPDYAYYENNNLAKAIAPISSIRSDTKISIFSTPNSTLHKQVDGFSKIYLGNDKIWFRDMYTWDVVSGRDETWKKGIIDILGEKEFITQYECAIPGTKSYNRYLKLMNLVS